MSRANDSNISVELESSDSPDHNGTQLTFPQRLYPLVFPVFGFLLVTFDYLSDFVVFVFHCINARYDYAISTFVIILSSGCIAVAGYHLSTKRKYKDCGQLFVDKYSLKCMYVPTFGAVICSFKYIAAKWREPWADPNEERKIVGGYSSSTLDMSSLAKWFKMVETVFEAAPQALLLIHTIIMGYSKIGIIRFVSMTLSFLGLTLNINNYWGSTLPFIYEPYTFLNHRRKFIGIKLLLFAEALAFILSRFLALNLAVFALDSHTRVNLLNAVLIIFGIIAIPRLFFYIILCESRMFNLDLKKRTISNISELKNSRRNIFLGKFFYSLVAYPAIDSTNIFKLIFPLYFYIENFMAFIFYYNLTDRNFIPEDVPFWVLNLFPCAFPISCVCFFIRNFIQRRKLLTSKNPKTYLTCCEKLHSLMDQNKAREIKAELEVLSKIHYNFFKIRDTNKLTQNECILGCLKFFQDRGKYYDMTKSEYKISKDGREVCYGHLSLVNICSYTLLRIFYYNKGDLIPFNNVLRLSQDKAEIMTLLYPLISSRMNHRVKDSEWMSLPSFDFRIELKVSWPSADIVFPPNIVITQN